MLNKIILVILMAAFAAIFYLDPALDLEVSSAFYKQGEGFYMRDNALVVFAYNSVKFICAAFVLGALISVSKKFSLVKSFHPKHYKKVIYVTLVCLLGPGLIVHTVFKDNFGRPRPHQIEQFGGIADFQSPLAVSNQCKTNCSFPSGHASVGYMFIALAFLYTGWAAAALSITSLLLGLSLGLVRIIQGGHFLSDIVFAGIVVYLTAYVLDWLIKPRDIAN
jgi:lipid A 4'-phosphatase